MSKPKNFYIVCEAGVTSPIARDFDSLAEADKAARALAEAHQGKTFVVFKPDEAYRAPTPRAEKIWLEWTKDIAETPAPADTLSIVAGEPAF